MLENNENKNNIKAIERFFCNNKKGAFLFVVGNDELIRNDILKKNEQLLFGNKKKVVVFSFNKNYNKQFTLLKNLTNFIKLEKSADGIILIDLEYLLVNDQTVDILTQINFSREALLELKLPILFWIKNETVSKFANQAADIYNQRVSSNLYFDYKYSKQIEIATDGYLMEKTASNNLSISQHHLRIKLLNEQLEFAINQNISNKNIANDIVIELLNIYVEIPNSETPINNLLNKYVDEFDKKDARTCFILANVNQLMNQFNESEFYFNEALIKYRELAKLNPKIYQIILANVLNNLGNLYIDKQDLVNAELIHKEALLIWKTLDKTIPEFYLPELAMTLSNLGNLESEKNDYLIAETYYKESLLIYRKLSVDNPKIFLSKVALILTNFGIVQSYNNDFTSALSSYKEALKIRRKLANINPEIYLVDVADTLNNLGVLQSKKSNFSNAEKYYDEALKIYKRLANINPETFLSNVAHILNNLGILYSDKKDFGLSELNYKEALKIYRKKVESNPGYYLPHFANLLINLSVFYQEDLINRKESISLIKEVILILIPYDQNNKLKEYLKTSFEILKDWKINPKTYLLKNFPNNLELLDLLKEEELKN